MVLPMRSNVTCKYKANRERMALDFHDGSVNVLKMDVARCVLVFIYFGTHYFTTSIDSYFQGLPLNERRDILSGSVLL